MGVSEYDIEPFLKDYAKVKERHTSSFVCPITLRECSLTELIDGHILNDAYFEADPRTIVQYGKVDHFYGGTVEAKAVSFLNSMKAAQGDLLRKSKNLRVRFSDSTEARAFTSEKTIRELGGRYPIVDWRIDTGKVKVCIEVEPDDPRIDAGEVSIVPFQKGDDLAWAATLVKAAYLCAFSMWKYRGVFSFGGEFVRSSLSRYYKDRPSLKNLENYFGDFRHSYGFVGHSPTKETFVDQYRPTDFDTLKDREFFVNKINDSIFASTFVFRINGMTTSVSLPEYDDTLRGETILNLYRRRFGGGGVPEAKMYKARFNGERIEHDPEPITFDRALFEPDSEK